MKNNTVGVFIYIQSNGEPKRISSMLAKVGRIAGVVNARINPNVSQLLDVEYEPQHISTRSIIDAVQQSGCKGALVGM